MEKIGGVVESYNKSQGCSHSSKIIINFPFSVALIEREVTMTQPFSTFPYLIHQENIPNQAEGYPYIYMYIYRDFLCANKFESG